MLGNFHGERQPCFSAFFDDLYLPQSAITFLCRCCHCCHRRIFLRSFLEHFCQQSQLCSIFPTQRHTEKAQQGVCLEFLSIYEKHPALFRFLCRCIPHVITSFWFLSSYSFPKEEKKSKKTAEPAFQTLLCVILFYFIHFPSSKSFASLVRGKMSLLSMYSRENFRFSAAKCFRPKAIRFK